MNQIDSLISELLLDARNGKQGLTDIYRNKFRQVLDNLMMDKNKVFELQLTKLIEHTQNILDQHK